MMILTMFDEVILATIGVLTLFQAQTRAAAGAAAAVPGSVAPQTLRVRGYTVNPGPIEGPVIAGLTGGTIQPTNLSHSNVSATNFSASFSFVLANKNIAKQCRYCSRSWCCGYFF